MARPTDYTPKLGEEICRRLAGGASLKEVCRGRDMPAVSTVLTWLIRDEAFHAEYIRARQAQALQIADDLTELIYALPQDIPEGQGGMPAVLARKYMLDNLRWLLTRMLPREFAEQPLLAINSIGRAQVKIFLPKKNSDPSDMRLISGSAVEVLAERDED